MFEEVEGKTLITGFHGIGMVGFIAVNYLAHKLDAERVDWMHEEYMPAVVFSTSEGLEMPVELYTHGDLALLKMGVMLKGRTNNKFISNIFKELAKHKPKEVIVVGGLATKETSVYGLANSKGEALLEDMGVEIFSKDITVFGPMASALIHGEKEGLPVACLLPNASPKLPDPKAASRAIQKLSERYGFEIDVQDLEEEAQKIKERLKEMQRKKEQTEGSMADRMFV